MDGDTYSASSPSGQHPRGALGVSSSDVAYLASPGARKERAHHRLSLDAYTTGQNTTAYNRTTYTVSGEQPAQPHGARAARYNRMRRHKAAGQPPGHPAAARAAHSTAVQAHRTTEQKVESFLRSKLEVRSRSARAPIHSTISTPEDPCGRVDVISPAIRALGW